MPKTDDDKPISTSVHLTRDLHERTKAHAATHHMPMAAVLRQALLSYLDQADGKATPTSLTRSAQMVGDIEGGLDRVRAEVVRLGDQLARLRQPGTKDS